MASIRSRRAVVGIAMAVVVAAVFAVRGVGKGPAVSTSEVVEETKTQDEATKELEEPSGNHSSQGEATGEARANDCVGIVAQEGNSTGEQWEVRRVEGDASQAAAEVLRMYKDEGDCVLCRAGYVDLFQNVWSCVVQGPGWVDMCVVSQTGDASGSEVKTFRMEAEEWGKDFGGQ